MSETMGRKFRSLVAESAPLQVLGTINAYTALLAEKAGAKAIYLSGAGVANASYGLPDLGMTNLSDVLTDARRITERSSLPLLVDIDTGWGHAFNIARSIQSMENAGVAAVHMEDQVAAKRCGHRPNKEVVSMHEMADRIKAAVDARRDPSFVIMARTDSFAAEGLQSAIERCQFYIEAGADMIFAEALSSLEQYKQFTRLISVPVLANITEFGKTPMYSRDELHQAGIQLILYPLSAFRAMSKVALGVYETIVNQGTQKAVLEKMQTREELYDILGYRHFEEQLDKYLGEQHGN